MPMSRSFSAEASHCRHRVISAFEGLVIDIDRFNPDRDDHIAKVDAIRTGRGWRHDWRGYQGLEMSTAEAEAGTRVSQQPL